MNRILRLSLLILIGGVLISSCNKKTDNPYSEWYIDGKKYSTNDASASISKGFNGYFSGNEEHSKFIFYFYELEFPSNGQLKIVDSLDNITDHVSILFFLDTNRYRISPYENKNLSATSQENGKAHYSLPKTWFVNYYFDNNDSLVYGNDSVLIYGEFNIP